MDNTALTLKEKILFIAKKYDIEKPSRYIGGELNACIKENADVKFVLCFPDLYEIGISNIGLSILYTAINSLSFAAAERVYAINKDFENILKEKNIPLYTLETFSPVKSADILGFTLQYELLYTNILQVLELSQIPLKNSERCNNDPIIIAGGPSVYNPTPLHEYIDLFYIGEADEKIKEITEIIYEMKKEKVSRENIIKRLASLEYIYSKKYKKEKTKRVFIQDLDYSPAPKQLVPLSQSIQNRISVEIARGCTHSCRFCLAGITYRPIRNRSVKNIINIVENSIKETGMSDVNLASLSADDYPNIVQLIDYLQTLGEEIGFSLSLPSLRIDSFDKESAKRISEFRKTGLTFALEVGSCTLRKKINKTMDEEAIFNIIKDLKSLNWKTIKIYFMLGFTNDLEEETIDIINTLKKISSIAGRGIKINAAVNVFVPKPHTPLENNPQLTDEEAIRLIGKLKDNFINTNVFIKFHPPRMAEIEGVLARGDEKVGNALLTAYKMGCRLDAWNEHFNYNNWIIALESEGVNIKEFLKHCDSSVWKHIDTLVSENFLEREYKKFVDAEFTEDCRVDSCKSCGVDNKYCKQDKDEKFIIPEIKTKKEKRDLFTVKSKIFIHYSKEGFASLLGMHDIKHTLTTSLKVSGVKIAFTQGYHPLPKIITTDPTPFGVDSDCEYAEVFLTEKTDTQKLKEELNNKLNKSGIKIISIEERTADITEEKNIKTRDIQNLLKNSVYKIITSDDERALILLSDKEKVKEKTLRGDYLIIKKDNNIIITLLNTEKQMRVRDIKEYIQSYSVEILEIRKIDLV